nr:hypothetical protein [Tanacetum cinerariifolium]
MTGGSGSGSEVLISTSYAGFGLIALQARNKMGFMDGSCVKSDYLSSVPLSNQLGKMAELGKHNQLMKLMQFLIERNLIGVLGLHLGFKNPRTVAKIGHVGNLVLTSNVILFDVLVIPEYTGPSDDAEEVIVDHQSTDTAEEQPFDDDHAASSMDDNPISEGNVLSFQMFIPLIPAIGQIWTDNKVTYGLN